MDLIKKAWRWVRWPLAVLLVAYIGLVIYRTNYFINQDKIAADVAAIHNNHLTHEDVFGPLPPQPDSTENNATLAGIDANHNGIRDDVEIAIYDAHKDSATTTAAMLQYAKALQMEFTRIYNSDTWVAISQEEERALHCLLAVVPEYDVEAWLKLKNESQMLVLNTQERQEYRKKINEYQTSFGLLQGSECDISV